MAKNISIKKIDDTLKAINFEAFGGFQGFLDTPSNGAGSTASVQQLRRVVPWLAKATDMTSNAIASLPFEIVNEGGTVIDSSADWKNKLGGMDNPQMLISMLAASLCLGRAYLIPTYTSKTIASLQYCAPHTVTPQINQNGLQFFDRSTDQGKVDKYYALDSKDGDAMHKMMYFWLPDSDVEIGPALSYPAGAALLSATLLFSMDGTIQTYSERGFVPATLLAVKGMPSPGEREKAEGWWNRFLRGWDKTAAKIMNAEAMDIKQVGAGMEQLKGAYGELTKQAIENVGTAFGIPAALFMSDMAFATEIKGLMKAWYETGAFVKIYKTIEDTFNSQLLVNYGLKLAFRPETLDVFADDEVASASAFKTYVDSGILPSVAAQMVGLEMPKGVTYLMLDAQVERKQKQEEEAARVNNEVALAKMNVDKEEKPEEKKPKVAEKRWVTMNGTHVLIGEDDSVFHGTTSNNVDSIKKDGLKVGFAYEGAAVFASTEGGAYSWGVTRWCGVNSKPPEAADDSQKIAIIQLKPDGFQNVDEDGEHYSNTDIPASDIIGIKYYNINDYHKIVDTLDNGEKSVKSKKYIGIYVDDKKPKGKSISLTADQIKELALWRQIAERCERKGKGRAVDFECKTIPEEMADDIRDKLNTGTIAQAFEITNTPTLYNPYVHTDTDALKALAEAINRATDKNIDIQGEVK